jgi:hypothetical protein
MYSPCLRIPSAFLCSFHHLQLGSYKVKVMLAEPKTKRQRPEQLVPGLFGPGGALGHLPPLGLDAASERALWGACWRGGGRCRVWFSMHAQQAQMCFAVRLMRLLQQVRGCVACAELGVGV